MLFKKKMLHDYWFCLCTSIFSEISGWQFGLLYCAIFMVISAIPFYLMLFIILSDFLTMQSLRDRYNEKDLFEVELTAPYVNEQDFDNYVREFVIDDAISECFAASEDSSPIFSFPVGSNVFYSLLKDVILLITEGRTIIQNFLHIFVDWLESCRIYNYNTTSYFF